MQNTTLYSHSFSYNTRVDLWLNRLELAVSLLFAIDVFNSKQSLKWYWIGPKLSRSCVCVCVCVGVCGGCCCCCGGWRRPSQLSAYSSALSRMCTAKVRPRTQEVEKMSKPAVCPLEVPSKVFFWPLQDLSRLPLALSSSSIG